MEDTFINFKNEVSDWAEKDWADNSCSGEMIIYNNVGGIKRVVSKDEYFSRLEKCKNLSEVKKWFKYVVGEDYKIFWKGLKGN